VQFQREKWLKKWNRKRKLDMIEKENPDRNDLYIRLSIMWIPALAEILRGQIILHLKARLSM